MAERMIEVVGWKDPIGGGLYNMGVTDERIVRCRDCMYSWVDGTLCNFWMRDYNFENPTPSNVEPSGFCKWGKPRSER